ncbi:4-hydroxy-3-methylbut-2-en-1-yl diphosphatesynthase [Striga asiatica]|uniref:4-hydroxy-3-methylbut-2-en-1-yl diphosphatesynthase n=1 Tax=Striga asiatica TaxID=4170 RepID=A0A5A7PSP0_STRAF|nr:4-hydroxy-3-methylbut-2-en-1-yl diphosphatesynthase [Striga asiatica]
MESHRKSPPPAATRAHSMPSRVPPDTGACSQRRSRTLSLHASRHRCSCSSAPYPNTRSTRGPSAHAARPRDHTRPCPVCIGLGQLLPHPHVHPAPARVYPLVRASLPAPDASRPASVRDQRLTIPEMHLDRVAVELDRAKLQSDRTVPRRSGRVSHLPDRWIETRPSATEALPSTVLPIVVGENPEQTELTAANCNAAHSPQIAEVTGQLHSIKFGSIPSEGCQDLLVPTGLLLPAQSSLSDGGDQVSFNPQLPLQVETYTRAKTSQTGLLTTKGGPQLPRPNSTNNLPLNHFGPAIPHHNPSQPTSHSPPQSQHY